jgi:SAM-dependent methyltransferase
VGKRSVDGMRAYWDERARENAAWYVDTSLQFDHPDMARFFANGESIVAEALEEAPVTPQGRSLAVEIGSGLGRICLALADRFDRVVGIDISSEMLERARSLVDHPNVTFELGDGSSLATIEPRSADLVVSFTVFQHMPDPTIIDGYLLEAGRILRPGGVVAFQWNNEAGTERWKLRRAWLSLLQRTGISPEQRGRHHPAFLGSRVPLDRIRTSLDRAGLRLVGTRGEGTLFCWAWAVLADDSEY